MKKEWLVKTLALGIVVLFISISFSSAISVENKTSIINSQSENNKSYVDPNIHLDKSNLPILKRSFKNFKNSNHYDAEIGKVMEQIIKLIESKGSVNSEDVENILINNDVSSIDIHVFCRIVGEGEGEDATAWVFPFLFLEILSLPLTIFIYWVFFSIGGFLTWKVDWYGNIRVGSKIYTGAHRGYAFGYFGIGLVDPPIWGGGYLTYVHFYPGFALIAFVKNL